MSCRVDLTLRGLFRPRPNASCGRVESLFHSRKIVVREPVELHEIVAGLAIHEDQFVELEVNLASIALLSILNQDDHQECTIELPVLMTSCQVSENLK
jgi:hypothetical protein